MEPLSTALVSCNTNLLNECERLEGLLDGLRPTLPAEVLPYFELCVTYSSEIKTQVALIVEYLHSDHTELLPELLSETQRLTRQFQSLNQIVVTPLFRASERDRLCLWVLRWLHAAHPSTNDTVVALGDGSFSIYYFLDHAPIYYVPTSSQQGLLYLPLLFHEFGHLLHLRHQQELHDLVVELQNKLTTLLEPALSRGDDYDQAKTEDRRRVVETWFDWMEEFFCDAVGYAIGGVAFVGAFSSFLLMKGDDMFYMPPNRLGGSSHPVSRIRIRLLTERLRQDGSVESAERIYQTWAALAETKGLEENYHGYFEDSFVPLVMQTLDDMLTEASPHAPAKAEEGAPPTTPSRVVQTAWQKFIDSPSDYVAWERETVGELILHIEQ
ncbi:MAG: hypothetical protein SFU83_02890 [Meiothermus sp.]|nr:hypothetical protein [Meiothermus sp.]